MNNKFEDIEYHVSEVFNKCKHILYYHNFDQSVRIVNYSEKLCKAEGVSEQDAEDIAIAAYFYNIGYTVDVNNPKSHSVEMCKTYLTQKGIDGNRIQKISGLILVSHSDEEPESLDAKIIKDAIYGDLTQKEFPTYAEMLRKEALVLKLEDVSATDWIERILTFIYKHRFYSNFAKENWQPLKENMVIKLVKEKGNIQKASMKMEKPPERAVDTIFRVALRNHIKLSDIADTKANLILSVNAMIVSIIIAILVPKLHKPHYEHLTIPTMVLLGTNVIAIFFAVISTAPRITISSFSREEVKKRKLNLLFFGNFFKASLDDYTWGMYELMNDRTYLYNALIKDLYQLGKVLKKKYLTLFITYIVFLCGLTASVVAYIIMFNTAS